MPWPDYPAPGPGSARRKLQRIIQNSDGPVQQHAMCCLDDSSDGHPLHATTSDPTKLAHIDHALPYVDQGAGRMGHPDYAIVLEDLNHEAGGGRRRRRKKKKKKDKKATKKSGGKAMTGAAAKKPKRGKKRPKARKKKPT